MANPFNQITPLLSVLATETQILPATGQAIIDMVNPDIEEAYDRSTGDTGNISSVWEKSSTGLYSHINPILRRQKHLFRYFLDGSVKTYFLGTCLEQGRSTPVQFAQVGAAAITREDSGQMHVKAIDHRLILLVSLNQLSDVVKEKLDKVTATLKNVEVRDISEDDQYNKNLGIVEPRSRGAHKANHVMRGIEIGLAQGVLESRPEEEWLMLDGSLGQEYIGWEGKPLVGVAKTFRRDMQFKLGSGPKAVDINLYKLLAGLEYSHRTTVFPRWQGESREGGAVFWYIRIRPQRALDYPLMGVVKVEIPNPKREPLEKDVVDLISGAIIGENSVTPYGADSRWHAHLYPIFTAEQVIKNTFFSEEVLRAGIKWPTI